MDEGQGQFLPEVLTEFFRHVYEAESSKLPGSTSAAFGVAAGQGGEDEASLAHAVPPLDSPQGLVRSAGEAEAASRPGRLRERDDVEGDSAEADPPAGAAEAGDEPREVVQGEEGDGEAAGQRKKRKRQSSVGAGGVALPEAVGRATEQAEVEGSLVIEGPHLERILPKLLLDF
ncbi:hypothetical protein CLOM_g6892 [Closterium sp. NIES-68]|nr:hypothetical protein CLOM_g6892 [Closterium sp. NIES-68]